MGTSARTKEGETKALSARIKAGEAKAQSARTRVGIYGGSFNPIHTGHTQLGAWLCDKGFVDELWFLVSPLNPHKVGDTSLLADDIRLHLVKMAVKESKSLKVSDFEMHLPKPSYMVSTLTELRNAYPDKEFVLVIGADNWERFPKWYKPEEILYHHNILIYKREGYQVDPATLPKNVQLVDSPIYNISSTEIRNAIAAGQCNGEWLLPNVWAEIQNLHLYGA